MPWRYGKDTCIHAVCKVSLDPTTGGPFSSGDEVRGNVEVNCDKPTLFYGCKVVLEGRVLVKFKIGLDIHTKTELLVERPSILAGDGFTKLLISPPYTAFPFTLTFPVDDLPGSYSSPNGSIIYQIVAYFSNSRVFFKRAEKTVNVKPQLTIPPSVASSSPVVLSGQGSGGGHWIVTLIQGSVYVIGEEILVNIVACDPDAESWIGRIVLHQKTRYSAGPSKTVKQLFGRALLFELQRNWNGVFRIPTSASPDQKGLIEIEHYLTIGVRQTGECNEEVTRECKIILCTSRGQESRPSPNTASTISRVDDAASIDQPVPEKIDRSPLLSELPTYSTLNLARSPSCETRKSCRFN